MVARTLDFTYSTDRNTVENRLLFSSDFAARVKRFLGLGSVLLATWSCTLQAISADFKVVPIESPAISESTSVPVANVSHQSSNHTASIRVTAEEIGCLASSQSVAARILRQHEKSEASDFGRLHHKNATLAPYLHSALEYRMRENAAQQALKLHHGLSATYLYEDVIQQASLELDRQSRVQMRLLEKGVAVSDSTKIDRTKLELKDKAIKNQGMRSQLRSQLSLLLDSQIACDYIPFIEPELFPTPNDICEEIRTGLRCRRDITSLKNLRGNVSSENLEEWDQIGAVLSAGVASPSRGSHLLRKFSRAIHPSQVQDAIRERRRWLDSIIEERSSKMASDIEVAMTQRETAYLRWKNTSEILDSWAVRSTQLERLGEEYQGNLGEQLEVSLTGISERTALVDRWLEWNQANVDLQFATGTILESCGNHVR